MVPDVTELDVDVPEISQVAVVVVEDLEDGMDRFGTILGVDPWEIYHFEPPTLSETTYRGEERDYSMALALADAGGTMIEPLDGESIYTEHLADTARDSTMSPASRSTTPSGSSKRSKTRGCP